MIPSRLLFPRDDYRSERAKQGAKMQRLSSTSRARMGAAIDLEQVLSVDRGVDLRGRQRGVTEQFLDGAQIAAARQQVRGERMTQRMRRRAVGQRKRAAQPLHGELHDSRRQRTAARAAEQRAFWRQ